jgi:hypothetical protein
MLSRLKIWITAIVVTIFSSGTTAAGDMVYGASHDHTPSNQPVRYWKVGVKFSSDY